MPDTMNHPVLEPYLAIDNIDMAKFAGIAQHPRPVWDTVQVG